MSISSKTYLTTLTPLRGIAALFIVFYHSNLFLRPFVPPGSTFIIDNAWLWVDFFFVLSGFIMCYAYIKYFDKGVTRGLYWKFLGARFARIYPLYFLTTIWVFVIYTLIVHYATSLDPFWDDWINLKSLPSCLLLIQSLHIYKGIPLNSPAWSLSTEWWVYMLFPFLVPFFLKLKNNGKIIVALAIVGFYFFLKYIVAPYDWISAFGNVHTLELLTDFGLLRCFAGFVLGMLLFTFYERRAGFGIIKQDWFFLAAFLGSFAALHFGLMDIATVAFFPFILLSAAYNDTRIKAFLDTRPLQRLGDWSFSIYMVHWPILFTFVLLAVKKNPSLLASLAAFKALKPDYNGGLIMCTILTILTLIVSMLTYRFVELPARNYLNKAFKTKRQPITPPAVQA